jgi:hypothetical protein
MPNVFVITSLKPKKNTPGVESKAFTCVVINFKGKEPRLARSGS